MRRIFVFGVCLMLLAMPTVLAAEMEADAIVGEWLTEGDESVIEICRDGDLYNGKVVWLKDPTYPDGKDKVDSSNPDESKRDRKIIRLEIVHNFKFNGKNQWTDGTIYDPNSGKTYSCKAKLKGNELHVRGFIGVSLLGRTTVWTRKAADSSE
jgi:uncharacterized protein (DUF2147 family)